MITAYFVRHGQSKDQTARVHQGSKTPLSPYGRSQAKQVAQRLKNLKKIDVIYASPFKRTKETAEIISRALNKPIEYWGDIGETPNPTELVGVYYKTKHATRIREIKKEKEIDPNWKYSDEESFNEQKARGLRILKHIENKHKGEIVVCVSHGIIIKLILALMAFGENLKAKEFFAFRDTFKMGNTGITMCKLYDEDEWKDGWKIISVNDITHL